MEETASSTAEKDNVIWILTIKELLALMKGRVTFTRQERDRKELLIKCIYQSAAPQDFEMLRQAALNKEKAKETSSAYRASKRKRAPSMSHDHGERLFMELPTNAERNACYARFYDATSNAAVETCICAVCAQERAVVEDSVMGMPLSLIPNAARLAPNRKHSAHDLYAGKLLEPEGIVSEGEDPIVTICHQCLEDLKKPANKPPKMSLANGLWIGRIPWALQVLTFPEQLLIALLYPRVYVFKLFPKRQQGIRKMASLQRAMRGNVSTYDLNSEAIASMVQGNLMPRPPAILASLISVTFIALGEVPKKWVHSTFRVRRQVVLEALCWLKVNNTKYYRDIEISPTRIQTLPDDDVPEEITAIIRQSEDVGVLEEENDSYVPQDDNEG